MRRACPKRSLHERTTSRFGLAARVPLRRASSEHASFGSTLLRPVLLAIAILLLAAAAPVAAEPLRVHFVDVGQGAAVLLEGAEGNVLVDVGQYGDAAAYLDQAGIEEIDLAIATHAHADHIGGFVDVFESVEVHRIWYNGQEHVTLTFERFIDAVLESEADYHEPGRGDRATFGELSITVLHPEGSAADYHGDLHDKNIVVRADYGDFSILLPGDAEADVERSLVERYGGELDSTVLKMGHHGSATSSSGEFVKAVAPEVAVYQAGADNRYGHPHDEAIARVSSAVAEEQIYGTDLHGTVVIESDGTEIDIVLETGPGDAAPAALAEQACIDINSAGPEELTEIIHIGEARAQEIVELRPFDSIDDLTRVPGIGPARLEDIREQGLLCPIDN